MHCDVVALHPRTAGTRGHCDVVALPRVLRTMFAEGGTACNRYIYIYVYLLVASPFNQGDKTSTNAFYGYVRALRCCGSVPTYSRRTRAWRCCGFAPRAADAEEWQQGLTEEPARDAEIPV